MEAAKVRAEFAEQEAALKKEKAKIMEQQKVAEAAHDRKQVKLDADIELLKQQKEVAAFDAVTHILEVKSAILSSSDSQEFQSLPLEDPLERVETFLSDH